MILCYYKEFVFDLHTRTAWRFDQTNRKHFVTHTLKRLPCNEANHVRVITFFLLTSGNNPIHQWQSITKILSRGGQGRKVAKARPYPPKDTVCHIELWQVSHKWCQKHSQKAQETSKERHDSTAKPFTQPACDWSKQIHNAHTDWAHPCWGKRFNNALVENNMTRENRIEVSIYRYLAG